MDWKIGEIRQVNDEWYQCLESNKCRCDDCDLDKIVDCCKIACMSNERIDNKDVCFKKLEKVGEPYTNGCKLFQRYKLFTPTNELVNLEIKQNKEDMEEYKMYDAKEDIPEFDKVVDECLFGKQELKLKPFDIQKAKEGKPVCTRDGRKARIICFDKHEGLPIVALVETKKNGRISEEIALFYINGRAVSADIDSKLDLMMLPEKKEGWINIYNADTTFYYVEGMVYNTKDEAIQKAKKEITTEQREKSEYVDTVKINWEE